MDYFVNYAGHTIRNDSLSLARQSAMGYLHSRKIGTVYINDDKSNLLETWGLAKESGSYVCTLPDGTRFTGKPDFA